MRTVAAVLALVACVHAGLWARYGPKKPLPISLGSWPAFPTPPSSIHPIRIPASARRLSRSGPISRPSPPIPRRSAPIRRPAAPNSSRRSPPSSASRSRSAPGSTRNAATVTSGEIRSAARACPPQQQRQRHHRRQRDDAAQRDQRRRSDQDHPRVKRSSPVPVSTGEIWAAWIEHPELASAVDFIAAHVLPYWAAL